MQFTLYFVCNYSSRLAAIPIKSSSSTSISTCRGTNVQTCLLSYLHVITQHANIQCALTHYYSTHSGSIKRESALLAVSCSDHNYLIIYVFICFEIALIAPKKLQQPEAPTFLFLPSAKDELPLLSCSPVLSPSLPLPSSPFPFL